MSKWFIIYSLQELSLLRSLQRLQNNASNHRITCLINLMIYCLLSINKYMLTMSTQNSPPTFLRVIPVMAHRTTPSQNHWSFLGGFGIPILPNPQLQCSINIRDVYKNTAHLKINSWKLEFVMAGKGISSTNYQVVGMTICRFSFWLISVKNVQPPWKLSIVCHLPTIFVFRNGRGTKPKPSMGGPKPGQNGGARERVVASAEAHFLLCPFRRLEG